MKSLLLIGGGGHCRSCIDVVEAAGNYRILGLVERVGGPPDSVLGYPVLGGDADLQGLLDRCPRALITVGQIKSPATRIRLYEMVQEMGGESPTIVSPRAYVSLHTNIAAGSIVMHGAVVNVGATIDVNCIVNSQALVEHDVLVGAHSHISTGARVNGGVTVGPESFVGSGAVIHEGVTIGARCTIAAGSIVRRDVPPDTTIRSDA